MKKRHPDGLLRSVGESPISFCGAIVFSSVSILVTYWEAETNRKSAPLLSSRSVKQFLFSLGLLLFVPVSAFPWGADGHKAIALAADAWLNEGASDNVHAILEDEKIEDAATWPDDIRGGKYPGKLFGTPEAEAFNGVPEHARNNTWHFVNLPLGLTDYGHSEQFTNPTDIVHIINKCVEVLEGQSAFMERRQALRWLIHLTGDIHQPLHVGVGFFSFAEDNSATLHRSPDDAFKYKQGNDEGGNKLVKENQKLHSFWDTSIPTLIAPDAVGLAAAITGNLQNVSDETKGERPTWAAQWATESAKVSNIYVYDATVTFQKRFELHPGEWVIRTSWPQNYGWDHREVVLKQLTLGAKRLADLLNSIKWATN